MFIYGEEEKTEAETLGSAQDRESRREREREREADREGWGQGATSSRSLRTPVCLCEWAQTDWQYLEAVP